VSPLKYFVYISDAKIEMLFAQIPKGLLSKIATELKIDLKILSATFKEKDPIETKYSKLKIVLEYLEEYCDIGTIENPKAYIKGTMPMHWGIFQQQTDLVVFGGKHNKTSILLSGSAKHVLGNKCGTEQYEGGSISFRIVALLKDKLKTPTEISCDYGILLYKIPGFVSDMAGPIEKFEFFARRLFQEGDLNQENILVGTPLYVALSDES